MTHTGCIDDATGLKLRVEFGRAWVAATEVSRLEPGSVIEIGSPVGQDVEVYADGRLVASGQVVAINGKLGVRVRKALAQGALRACRRGQA